MFAVFFGIAMNSVNKGVFDHMENGMISSFIGFAQIHGEGYWEDQTLDYAFVNDKSLNKIAEQYHEIDDFYTKIRVVCIDFK